MKIGILVDNVSSGIGQPQKNSNSYYIETNGHKILFDLGVNGMFLSNAKKQKIDIPLVDTLVLSSGFAEAGGGIKDFLKVNTRASIYIQNNMLKPLYINHMGMKRFCGVNQLTNENPQNVFTNNLFFLDDNIELMSNALERKYQFKGSTKYYVKTENGYELDNFSHEQYLIIEESDRYFLFTGSTNLDISNIKKKAESICNHEIDFVFTEFSLLNRVFKKSVNHEQVYELLEELKMGNTIYYTSKLTGKDTTEMLKTELTDKVVFFDKGDMIRL